MSRPSRPSKGRSLLDLVRLSGFSDSDRLIHLFVGGSELHGAKVGETDDTDLYGVSQFKRLTGEKGSGKKGQRPEYIGKFGYDTKAAMHGLRLLYECHELMTRGAITLPRPEKDMLIEIRGGAWTLEKVLRQAQKMFKEVEEAVAQSPLPERVDRPAISRLVAQAHLEFWAARD